MNGESLHVPPAWTCHWSAPFQPLQREGRGPTPPRRAGRNRAGYRGRTTHHSVIPRRCSCCYRRPLPTSPAPEIDQTLSAHWSRDGRRLFAALRPAGQGARAFRIYLREGDEAWRAVTPEATAGVFAVSPDGASVALRDDTGVVGAVPARRRRAAAAGMHRRDVATGRIESWRSIAPADPADVFHVVSVVRASDSQLETDWVATRSAV